MTILEASHLAKSYKDSDLIIEVLKDANLLVNKGDLICITGKSGCGKSTLLHLLGLLDNPDSGKILINGTEISSSAKEAPTIRNRDLGFVFQFHYLVEDLNAVENVALPMLIAGHSKAKSLAAAKELLAAFGLSQRFNHYANQLSGGEQQRVSLARALINNPKVVLADEPTGNLDPEKSSEIWDTIIRLNRELEQAFVVITHDREQARLASTTYELEHGVLSPVIK